MEKTANTEYGTSTVDNSIVQVHMTMLLLVLSGLLMGISSLSVLSKCSDSVIDQVGLTLSTNLTVDLY